MGDVIIGTLVHRPSLGGWRLHALGGHVRPEVAIWFWLAIAGAVLVANSVSSY